MPTFQNRQQAVEQICSATEQDLLLNIYGEAGIGKSRLLQEARQRLEAEQPDALVLYVDFSQLAEGMSGKPEGVLRALIAQAQDWLSGVWQDVEQVAAQVVVQLLELAKRAPVILMFDTTEVLQGDADFWRWMEANLVGPLAVEEQVCQVFAGRVPVPWRRVEVRRAVKLLRLGPLARQDAASDLVREVLVAENPALQAEQSLPQAVDLVLDFSFGHPELSEQVGAYVAERWPVASLPQFRRQLCREVVNPFVRASFFKDVEPPWDEILWLASVLDWFDATILRRYLERVAPQLIEGKLDYFFVRGISRLRVHHTVVWREERGDRLHGVIGDVMRHCFKISEPDRYRQACIAAAETMEALADEFPPDDPEAQQYLREAQAYRQRVEQEA